MRYHINPKTGNVGKCSALKKCPFENSEYFHYSDREKALKQAEFLNLFEYESTKTPTESFEPKNLELYVWEEYKEVYEIFKDNPRIVGRTRVVFFLEDGAVVKVPFTEEGIAANRYEADVFNEEDPFIKMAKCNLEKVTENSPEILRMEKVTPILYWDKPAPDWVSFVDCQQVGINSKGDLVAYDL